MITLTVSLDGRPLADLAARLQAISADNFDAPLRAIGESARNMALDAFAAELSPEGAAWPKSKRAMADGGLTLTDTATLKNSIGVSVGDGEVSIGTNIVYAAIHQLGGKAGRGHRTILPPRPFLPSEENQELQADAMDFLSAHLQRQLAA